MNRISKNIYLFRNGTPKVKNYGAKEECSEQVEDDRLLTLQERLTAGNILKKPPAFKVVVFESDEKSRNLAEILMKNSANPVIFPMSNIEDRCGSIAIMCTISKKEDILVVASNNIIIGIAVSITQDPNVRSIDLDFCEGIKITINEDGTHFHKISDTIKMVCD
jgi:hypothetical protein